MLGPKLHVGMRPLWRLIAEATEGKVYLIFLYWCTETLCSNFKLGLQRRPIQAEVRTLAKVITINFSKKKIFIYNWYALSFFKLNW